MNRILLPFLLLTACVPTESDPPAVDAGVADMGFTHPDATLDASSVDSRTEDTGTVDSGTVDSGPPDSGPLDRGSVRPLDTAGLTNEPLWEPPANAVHIDPDANDPAEDGSLAHPYNSISDITWVAGTVYAIKRGTTMQTDVFGIGANDVTLASYGTGPRPIIHCTANTSSGNRYALMIDNRQDVTFRDLEVMAPDATSLMRFQGGSTSNIRVLGCSLHDSAWGLRAFSFSGLYVHNTEIYNIKDDGMYIQGVEQIEVSHVDVHDVNQNWTPPYTPQSEAGGDAIQFSDCNHWHVHHSVLDRTNSGNKFCFISNNANQDDGILEYNKMAGPLTTGDGGSSIYFHDGDGLIVRYNEVVGPSPGPLYTHATNVQIYGNLFTGLSGGIMVSGSAEVYNNVFHDAPAALSGGDFVVRNNIFALSGDPFGNTSSLQESHNLFANGTATANSIEGDPSWVDAANGDFHIQEGSDCIDNGTDVGIAIDLDGTTIPKRTGFDVGPYELE